ncbi:MAG: hypothetical protein IPI91_03965 [Flavobacteriales bacterium]|nr:hypothetical protein [Flavobacteriales bacterium]
MMIRKGVITWCLTMGIALNMLGQNTVGLVDIEADRAEDTCWSIRINKARFSC